MPSLPPLLLTSCVTVSAPFTQITDQTIRVELTIQSIQKWLCIANDLKIVICDGSNYDFSAIVADNFPYHAIECLSFNNDTESVAKHGKGYGEGEIIKYALAHSTFLNEADYFAKCTSKMWVNNFLECHNYWNGFFLADCDFAYFKKFKLFIRDNGEYSFCLISEIFAVMPRVYIGGG